MNDLIWLTEEQAERLRFAPERCTLDESAGRGVLTRMVEGLAIATAEPGTIMSDATYVKAHRMASSLRVKKGISAS